MAQQSLHEVVRAQRDYQPLIDAHRAGASLDVRDETGATPLHRAVEATIRSTIIPAPGYALLALGAAPDLADADGVRPLHLACAGRKADMALLLLALGADPHHPDRSGRTPLDRLAERRGSFSQERDRIAAWLGGAPLSEGTASLVEAAQQYSSRPALLLRRGADLAERDAEGNTALHVAASSATTAALLALGADPCATNRRGETPLHCACDGIGPEITLLLNNGADPRLRDGEGRLAVERLRAQSFPYDFYDGDRLERARAAHIRRLEQAAG